MKSYMEIFQEISLGEAQEIKVEDFDLKRIEKEIESAVSKMIEVKLDINGHF